MPLGNIENKNERIANDSGTGPLQRVMGHSDALLTRAQWFWHCATAGSDGSHRRSRDQDEQQVAGLSRLKQKQNIKIHIWQRLPEEYSHGLAGALHCAGIITLTEAQGIDE